MTKDPRYPFALDLGTEIGGYRIDAVLGAGGFGITYRAFNDITHKQVAIKEFYIREISTRDGVTVIVDTDVERSTYEYALRKFQEEAQAVVTRFKHPYIIQGENFVRAHNTCYLIMEYVEGSNLDDWLKARDTPPAEAEIRPFFEKLFDAVDYVHHHNMMHRDLTPRNIMVRPNGDPVLIDFGAAGLGIDLGRSSKIVAQLRYAPPEQSDETASGVHGRYTDIFSLAGVLFRVVTGKTPMAPTVRLTRLSHQRDATPAVDPQGPVATLIADPQSYSAAFLAGIDRGLLLDERLRPQSITEFRIALGWSDMAPLTHADSLADAATAILPALQPTRPTGQRPLATVAEPATRLVVPPAPADVSPVTALDPTVALVERPPRPSAKEVEAPVEQPAPRRGKRLVFAGVIVLAVFAGLAVVFQSDLSAFVTDFQAPPVITPYRVTVRLSGNTIDLSGHIASETDRASIRAAIPPAMQVADRFSLGRGAPPGYVDAIKRFLADADRMSVGEMELIDKTVRISATAASPATFSALRTDLSGLVDGGRGTLSLTPASVTPYRLSVTLRPPGSTPRVEIVGYVPDETVRAEILARLQSAVPDATIADHAEIARGNQVDIGKVAAAALSRFADLRQAALSIDGSSVRLEGVPVTSARLAGLRAPLDPALTDGARIELAISPLVISPYEFKAEVANRTLTLSGVVPNDAVQAELDHLPHGDLALVDQLVIGDGAPPRFLDAARFAVGTAVLFETGGATLTDQRVTIGGLVRRVADISDLKIRLKRDVPEGYQLVDTNYQLREDVAAQPCDHLALPPDAQDRPAGVAGIDTAHMDAAKALAACQQAVDQFPNVARFTTALAIANERAGHREEAIRLYRLSVEADDPAAMARLGLMLRDGSGVPVDLPHADALFQAAAKLGNPLALFALGQLVEKGAAGHPRSLNEAVHFYERAAEGGNADAETRLGLLAEAGSLTGAVDRAAARTHFAKAANAGQSIAMAHLARSYLSENDGNPPPADRVLARTWFTKAVEAGRIEEAPTLAALLLDPRAGPVDAPAANAVLAEAAGKGNANAMVELARMTFLGLGTARNTTQAADWTERAASAGRIDAYARLASLYQSDTADGRRPDYASAFLWAQKGVARSDAEAFFVLGTLYEGGLGRPIDFVRAEDAYQRAADLGSAKAAYQLGLLAEAGHGRAIDLFRAASYFKRAADLGYAPAMIRFGQMAGSGRGMLRDDTAALIAFTKALQLGDPEGYWQAALLTDAGRGAAPNPQRAAAYALEAIARGNAHALAAVETDLVDLSAGARRALKQLLATRGLVAHPSDGDTIAAPERDALRAASRSPQ